MLPHHTQSIENATQYFRQQPEVLALLLGGSIAHGFATAVSDVDVMILVSDEEYAKRLQNEGAHFFNRELCTYPEGYVDGKYLTPTFLEQVEARGSEPARFAFKDACVLFSSIDGLSKTIESIVRYPVEQKTERTQRFYAQLQAWHWYAGEALKHQNPYLLNLSINKLILFSGRMILAHNDLLFPYHKWFLRVLEHAHEKPADLMSQIEGLIAHPDQSTIDRYVDTIKEFQPWGVPDKGWPNQFMIDSEWNWINGQPSIDDL
jgi:hypothetical protein